MKKRKLSANYKRRLERAAARGFSKSQARGHPRDGEAHIGKSTNGKAADRLQAALALLDRSHSMTAAAKTAGVSPERLRRHLTTTDGARKHGRRWVPTARLCRRVPHITGATTKAIIVPGFEPASEEGKHHNAVYRFVTTGDESHLEPFYGKGVHDAKGHFHPFETDPNELYRYASTDQLPYHEIYTIISN